jgi:hypothetical protein
MYTLKEVVKVKMSLILLAVIAMAVILMSSTGFAALGDPPKF